MQQNLKINNNKKPRGQPHRTYKRLWVEIVDQGPNTQNLEITRGESKIKYYRG